ncbi:DUF6266 family protein [Flavobacterium sp. N1994]|uniref:DUF6266 family protein n=1 Tax=Flavobacterium sp. N1994 TaxID=2986827 RepID=UPI0022225661|nr:DUF6266 family protein [Flavobacterium sp. N1994]
MGTYNKGILGPFSGKVGTVIGANWRGKDVMRSLPKKNKRTPSETQKLQRQLFTNVSEFLTPISPVLSLYFGRRGGEQSRRNQATSYHMRNAVQYVAPDFTILYNKVQISRGDLEGIQNPAVIALGGNKVSYTWDNNADQGSAKASDQLIVVLYAPAENLYYYLLNAATRDATTVILALPNYFVGLEVQSWITFASADNTSYATSVYMGAVTVS